jgi:hypothetical protein
VAVEVEADLYFPVMFENEAVRMCSILHLVWSYGGHSVDKVAGIRASAPE